MKKKIDVAAVGRLGRTNTIWIIRVKGLCSPDALSAPDDLFLTGNFVLCCNGSLNISVNSLQSCNLGPSLPILSGMTIS